MELTRWFRVAFQQRGLLVRTILRIASIVALAAFLVAPSASFANHVAGVKATVTNVDVNSLQVDLDVTEYYDGFALPYATAYIGSSGSIYTYLPAISWGDGGVLSPQAYPNGIPIVATSVTIQGFPGTYHIYRGSFSHVYANEGNYQVTVASVCCAGYTGSNVTITGNPLITSSYKSPYVNNITNTVTVDFANQGPEESILAIPTLSKTSLLLLAGALAFAGLLLLRR